MYFIPKKCKLLFDLDQYEKLLSAVNSLTLKIEIYV